MPATSQQLAAWNKNNQHGVAVCLLENWVEERAISDLDKSTAPTGDDATSKVVHEAQLKRNRVIPPQIGPHDSEELASSTRATYKPPRAGTRDEEAVPQISYSPRQTQFPMPCTLKGTRRAQMEAALWEQANRETKLRASPPSSKDWASTYREAFHKEFESIDDLLFADEDLLLALQIPMSIWQEHRRNKAFYVSSLRRDPANKGQDQTTDGFGKNAEFSTPTELYLKGSRHDL